MKQVREAEWADYDPEHDTQCVVLAVINDKALHERARGCVRATRGQPPEVRVRRLRNLFLSTTIDAQRFQPLGFPNPSSVEQVIALLDERDAQ